MENVLVPHNQAAHKTLSRTRLIGCEMTRQGNGVHGWLWLGGQTGSAGKDKQTSRAVSDGEQSSVVSGV